jgi:hypothetical protein
MAGRPTVLTCPIATLIYRCPTTGMNVQTWLADDVSINENKTYEPVACLACTRVHLVNRSTGRTLGVDEK